MENPKTPISTRLISGNIAIDQLKSYAKCRQDTSDCEVPKRSNNDSRSPNSKAVSSNAKNGDILPWMWALRLGVRYQDEFDQYVDFLNEKDQVNFWKHIVALPQLKGHKWDMDVLEKAKIDILLNAFEYSENTISGLWQGLDADLLKNCIKNGFLDLFVNIRSLSYKHQIDITGFVTDVFEHIKDKKFTEGSNVSRNAYHRFATAFSTEQCANLLRKMNYTPDQIGCMDVSDDELWQLFQNVIENGSVENCIDFIKSSDQLKSILQRSFDKMGMVYDKMMKVKFFTAPFLDRCYSIARYLPPLCFCTSNRVQDSFSAKIDCIFLMFKKGFLFEFLSLFAGSILNSMKMYMVNRLSVVSTGFAQVSACNFNVGKQIFKFFKPDNSNESNMQNRWGFFS